VKLFLLGDFLQVIDLGDGEIFFDFFLMEWTCTASRMILVKKK
jgi:hypothetical protein